MEENMALFSAVQLGVAFKLNLKLSRYVVVVWDWGVKWWCSAIRNIWVPNYTLLKVNDDFLTPPPNTFKVCYYTFVLSLEELLRDWQFWSVLTYVSCPVHNEAVCHVQVDLLLNTRHQKPLFHVLSSSKNGDFSKTKVLIKMFGGLHNHYTIYLFNIFISE